MKRWTEGTTRRIGWAWLDALALAAACAVGLALSARLHTDPDAAAPTLIAALAANTSRLLLIGAALGCWLTATGALHIKTFRRPADIRDEAGRLLGAAGLAALSVFPILALWPGIPMLRAVSDSVIPALAVATAVGCLRATERLMPGARHPGRRVVFVEPGQMWLYAIEECRAVLGDDWKLSVVTSAPTAHRAGMEGVEFWSAEDLEDWLARPLSPRATRRTLLVFDRRIPHNDAVARIVSKAYKARAVIADMAEFYEEVLEKAPLIESDSVWLANPSLAQPPARHLVLKRAMDLVIAVPLFVATLPLVAALAALVRLESPGSPIFTQRRVGLGGRDFVLYKLRSMALHEDDSAQWPHFAAGKITRIGKFLRKSGLDELPQLVNVIRGDMSLIGPRPARPLVTERHIARNPFYAVVCSVKPGISGWAQLHQGQDAGDHTMFQKARYNLYYARHFTIWLDLLICIRTFWQLVSGRKPASVYLAEEQARQALSRGANAPAELPDRRLG